MTVAIVLAALCGGFWRRWWGDARPSYAFRGYRAVQASVGVLALFGCCWVGSVWWLAAIKAGLAIGFLATMAESVPHVWKAWEEIYIRWGVPNLGRMLKDWTAYAKVTAGALVWAIAVAL